MPESSDPYTYPGVSVIRALGLQAGFPIDWTKITRDQVMAASRDTFATGDSSGLAALILLCIQ